jgi:hypothetical protein
MFSSALFKKAKTLNSTTNLKYWAEVPVIIEKTLNLFHDLAGGYSSGKLIVKLEITNHILQHTAVCYYCNLYSYSNSFAEPIF